MLKRFIYKMYLLPAAVCYTEHNNNKTKSNTFWINRFFVWLIYSILSAEYLE